jgi:predicted nucleic acid-binding protein
VKVLVDTDVLIDVALDRAPHAEAASALLDTLEARPGTGFVAWHSVANFYYLVAPTRGRGDTRKFVVDLVAFLDVAPTGTESVRQAARMRLKDFEDALQVAAALASAAEVIATRNVSDYRGAPVPAALPESILGRLEAGE